jgi:hypothetical protein
VTGVATQPIYYDLHLDKGRRVIVTRLRELADRLEQLPVTDAYEVMAWLQPHVDQSLADSDRIL